MPTILFTFLFGIFLGFKHALEADHLTAVMTLVTEHKNSFRAALIGTFWGIGHTTTLFMVGLAVLILKINIPLRLGLGLESLVGIMLVILGIRALLKTEELMNMLMNMGLVNTVISTRTIAITINTSAHF